MKIIQIKNVDSENGKFPVDSYITIGRTGVDGKDAVYIMFNL